MSLPNSPRSGYTRSLVAIVLLVGALAACSDDSPTAPPQSRTSGGPIDRIALARQVRALAAQHGVTQLQRPPFIRPALVRLGQMLAFDNEMSGNRDISCMSCHLPSFGTSDGRTLPIGADGIGLGPARTLGAGVVIPRNAPAAFDLLELKGLFWDGRVSVDEAGHYHTPAGDQLTPAMQHVMEFGALSAQPMFPPTTHAEMRGAAGNELAALPDADLTGIWQAIMSRLGKIPEYRRLFEAAYPGTRFDGMTFANASNAIAAFLVQDLTFRDSPWDRFLAGDDRALTDEQLKGAKQFLSLKCAVCHDGPLFSDGKFHDVALAQLGPGVGDGPSHRDDFGRYDVTHDPADLYAFRTTPLRNVELSAPYGHAGQYATLRAFIDHYSKSDEKLRDYDISQVDPSLRGTQLDNQAAVLAARDTLLKGVVLPDSIVDQLTAYMAALTSPSARDLRRIVPRRVPSGLPIDY